MSEAPRFGTAGLSDSYRVRSFDPQAMAEYTASFGLTAFEYQCGRGVRLGLDKAAALKEAFDAKGITFSVHAPYYISMSSLEEDKRLNSVNYLRQLRQTEPGSRTGKGTGHHAPRRSGRG